MCVYVSTEMFDKDVLAQAKSLGWSAAGRVKPLYASILEKSGEIRVGEEVDVAIIDVKTLRFLAARLNRLVREERSGSSKVRYFWYNDPDMLVFSIVLGLVAVGFLEAREKVTPESVRQLALFDAGRGRGPVAAKSGAPGVRVVVDSLAPYIVGRYSVVGRLMTDIKYRLAHEKVTYLVVNHTKKTGGGEDELGAEVGHVVDGRLRLWHEIEGGELRRYGIVLKMRMTEHDARVHKVELIKRGDIRVVRWVDGA